MTGKTKQNLKGIFGIILGLSIFLEFIPQLTLPVYFLQPFIFLYANLAVKNKKWYNASLITLCVSNMLNFIFIIISYINVQSAIDGLKSKNLIASEQFSTVVTAIALPAIYKILIAVTAVITLIVFIECIISHEKRNSKLKKENSVSQI